MKHPRIPEIDEPIEEKNETIPGSRSFQKTYPLAALYRRLRRKLRAYPQYVSRNGILEPRQFSHIDTKKEVVAWHTTILIAKTQRSSLGSSLKNQRTALVFYFI